MLKRTKIVATISDKHCDRDFIKTLYDNGMDVVRMNSAHLDSDGMAIIAANVRAVSPRIALMLDTKGPEIRTTAVQTDDGGDSLYYKEGDRLVMVGDASRLTTQHCIALNYNDIAADVKAGDRILIDDGALGFVVESVEPDGRIMVRALNDGRLGSRKSVNLPGVRLDLPSLSERDKAVIASAVGLGVDFIAHSFVRDRHDVEAVQAELDRHHSDMKIISKIENQQGIDNFDEILDASYGIMVARGDLGIEVAAERIPGIQIMMIRRCIAAHKPVIVATQMLHSMIENPRPTRAEVSDVANAVFQQADALMLSGETASGRYPVEAVATMARIAAEVEHSIELAGGEIPPFTDGDVTAFLARQAVVSEHKIATKAVVTDSYIGRTARIIASFRGSMPSFAICYTERLSRWLNLSYGVTALYVEDKRTGRGYPVEALKALVSAGRLKSDDRIAYLASMTGVGATSLEINTVSAFIDSETPRG